VLDNDEDEDGDQLEITDAGNPSNGTAVAIDDDGDGVKDAISYTPSNSPDTVTFEYTISDGNGGTDTAEVTVNVTGDESSCGPLTVRVEDPDGNLVPGVGFEPKYDGDNNGEPEQLPKRGMATGKFTYPVEVDDDPSLSKMNESLITEFPDGFATSVDFMEKDVEKTAGQAEPDDHWYPVQQKEIKKSKLATDPDDDNNSPNAVLSCSGSQDQTFGQDCVSQYGQDAFAAVFDASGSTDPENDIDTYDWTSQNGNIDETTDHPDADIQYCVNTASQSDTQDTVAVEVTDDEENSDSASKQIGDMCPFGGGGCSEVSVQDDFSGDNLSGSDSIERGETSQDTTEYPFTPDPKTATLDVSSILSSGESAGDMIVEFSSTSNGFSADVNCAQAEDPSQCGASTQIAKGQTQLRSVSVTGDPAPNAFAENNADLSFNVDDNETVELNTSANAVISANTNSDAEGSISITDITLEVCDS
jgi:hypothetical protein